MATVTILIVMDSPDISQNKNGIVNIAITMLKLCQCINENISPSKLHWFLSEMGG